MDLVIRPARPDDRDAIVAFTRETFPWGDYVPDRIDGWLADPEGLVLVAADIDDRPLAMGRAELLSPAEAWFHAARVHPDHRGRGIAQRVAVELRAWARRRGAKVARLLVEDTNEASKRSLAKMGFRPVARFLRGRRGVGRNEPSPTGNGGRRVPAALQVRPAPSAEARPAYASWSVGELGRTSRGLFLPAPWRFRRLTVEDLVTAAKAARLWEVGGGWLMASPLEDTIEVGWLETRPEEARDVLRAAVDLAGRTDAAELVVWLPDLPWTAEALRGTGFETAVELVYVVEP